jgi:hypothetical protein
MLAQRGRQPKDKTGENAVNLGILVDTLGIANGRVFVVERPKRTLTIAAHKSRHFRPGGMCEGLEKAYL